MKGCFSYKMVIIYYLFLLVNCRDCYLGCDEVQITYDKQLCIQGCNQKVIVGSTVGAFCGICIILCFICYCRYRTFTCIYFIKRELKKKFNVVDHGLCTPQQFKKQASQLFGALRKSEIMNNFYFQFKSKKETMRMDVQSFNAIQEENFLANFTFKGKDDFSSFVVDGYFLYRDGRPFLWFLKRYDPYQSAIQLGMKEIVIFESANVSQQAVMGIWYDEDQNSEQAQRIKGKWSLIMKVRGITNRWEEVTPSTQLY